ncbi:cache domain-containing protein [Desulfovibrio sp. JC022]|uniref:cache domain-containing protein n=1 Tax=Desulfovibrio sp. JC022 TaxID=2593642 RepID=UPI0013D5ADE9|nr:cache domain-containing protein [Desulfovibrio sp. JC022]NDV22439.1 PAS domain S-box protein [Desulfovibrio sp. JC022]
MGVFEKSKGAGSRTPVWLRVAVPTVASLLLFIIALFAVHMPAVRDALLVQRKESLKHMTQVAIGVLDHLRDQEIKGIISSEEARRRGAEIIGMMRFGPDGKDYFWINDFKAKMVMHPYMPELDGRDMSKFADFKGKLLIVEMVNATEKDGAGYVNYHWQWQDKSDKVVPKISYVQRFYPWKWIVGTGLYLDDIESEAAARNRELIMMTVAILGLISLLSFYTIVQSRRAGKDIQESEALFKGIFNHSQQFMGVLSPEGVLLLANKESMDFVEADKGDIIGHYLWETPWWDDSLEAQRQLKELIQIASFGGVGKGIFRHDGPDGNFIYVDFSAKPVVDDNGKVLFLIAEGHNVTELKEAQEQIALSEAMFRGVFSQSLQFMGVVDLDGNLREVNKAALDIRNVVPEDVLDRPFWEGPWWQDPPSLMDNLKEDIKNAANGHIIRREVRTNVPDGGSRYVDFSLKPAFGADGKIIFLLAEGRDISELRSVQDQLSTLNRNLEQKVEERTAELRSSVKRLENAQNQLIQSEKMAALGDLVAGVAHEINTPVGISVTSISFMEEKLKEISSKMDSGQLRKSDFDKFVSIAKEATKSSMLNLHRAAELIGNFKQVAADQASGQKRTINFHEYIDEILLSLRSKYKRTLHKINISCDDSLVLNTYPGAYMQIFSNLIINSLIHGFEGVEAGNIDIGVEVGDEDIIIRYTDDGKGMSEANVNKIFEPFFTTKRGAGGTGLGMSIVYNLVHTRLGGSITCSSVEGQGTAFTILLPKDILVED